MIMLLIFLDIDRERSISIFCPYLRLLAMAEDCTIAQESSAEGESASVATIDGTWCQGWNESIVMWRSESVERSVS